MSCLCLGTAVEWRRLWWRLPRRRPRGLAVGPGFRCRLGSTPRRVWDRGLGGRRIDVRSVLVAGGTGFLPLAKGLVAVLSPVAKRLEGRWDLLAVSEGSVARLRSPLGR